VGVWSHWVLSTASVTQGGGWHCSVHAQWQERSEGATWQAQVMHKARASWALQ
jgi:hypothetical protein